MKDIVIVGAGGFGREVAWLIEDINKVNKTWNIIGFVDETTELLGTLVDGYKVVGNIDWLKEQNCFAVLAIGDTQGKKKIVTKLEKSEIKYATLIHPNVISSDRNVFGEGSIICAGTIITVNVKIGNHVIVNINSTIGHEAVIRDFATILPSVKISGAVVVEECVNIGTGSAIIQGKNIGKNTIIGANATVVKDIPENCTAVGSPAKPIKFH